MGQVTPASQRAAAGQLRETLTTYKEAEDLINIGAYAEGSNPRIDRARRLIEPVRAWLRQGVHERTTLADTVSALEEMFTDEEFSLSDAGGAGAA